MIRGQYQRAWEIYEELQKEFERNPERVRDSQPIVYFALAEEAPRINKVKLELAQAREAQARISSEASDAIRKLTDERDGERLLSDGWHRTAEAFESRVNELEVQHQPAALTFEPGEREALMERGWRKAV